ncbi:dolichyl-diphosphooligosaccharide---protein glycotransferase [Synchytrium microbalum]|uniref:Dolichyl-diphosphooligosaccharide--protein glycosyltransferase subunit 1 n=1 Tax=Synchytrium microbalum TaxID=1806994 RepID=A0A507CFX2_9FUNG|nr:dolichyl-diphosphooligosaccharide---protein glycotransferase [Synchytrium microbalum]TPX38079.1 dolichyl-diphosphooligosaccharide---protein glycotransferase [Synchytrium microbalum]
MNIVTIPISSILLLLLICLGLASAKSDRIPLINENVERTIDLTSAITRETTKVTFRVEEDGKSTDEYIFALPLSCSGRLASLDMLNDAGIRLDFAATWGNQTSQMHMYRAKLKSSMSSGTVTIKAAFTKRSRPYPIEIPQSDKQYLEFFGSANYVSGYPTTTQKTTIRLPNSNVITFSANPSPAAKSGNAITYGPYKDVAANTINEINVHYEDSKPVLVAKSLFRDVWVSHWGGQLSVEEHYELANEGAKLKGQFSRIDYAFSAATHDRQNVLRQLTLTFPPKANNAFYRDTVGNVSTSKYRNERTKSVMEIKPRYPVWGGWKYTWYHGYSVPLSDFLRHRGSKYALAIPFIASTTNVTHDKVTLRVVLPEGADNVRVAAPFLVDHESQSIVYWYLDTVGRPAVTLEKNNVVDEHNGIVYVSYDYADYNLYRKPLLATGVFFALFVLSMIVLRLDFSIIPDEKSRQDDIIATFRISIIQAASGATVLFKNMQYDFEKAKDAKSKTSYTSTFKAVDITMGGLQSTILEGSTAVEDLAPKLASGALQLSKAYSDKLSAFKKFHGEVLDVLTESGGGEVDEGKKKMLSSSFASFEEKQAQLDDTIRGLVKELGMF